MGFGIFGQSKYQSLSQFFYIFENKNDFWSVFVSPFLRKPSLWAPKKRTFDAFSMRCFERFD